jgi:hypothetical protein
MLLFFQMLAAYVNHTNDTSILTALNSKPDMSIGILSGAEDPSFTEQAGFC